MLFTVQIPNRRESNTNFDDYISNFLEIINCQTLDNRLKIYNENNKCTFLLIWKTKNNINFNALKQTQIQKQFNNRLVVLYNDNVYKHLIPLCRAQAMFIENIVKPPIEDIQIIQGIE